MIRIVYRAATNGLLRTKPAGHIRSVSSVSSDGIETSSSSDSEFSDVEDNSKQSAAEDTKILILKSALSFVSQHGWTKHSLSLGAEQAGFPGVAHGLFERGEVELVEYFYRSANEQLSGVLAERQHEKKPTDVFIYDAVSMRLKMLIPYIDSWPEAMALMSRPSNVPYAITNLGKLVDDIWYYAGDRSTMFDWYSKRASLAAVYGSTQLYMIQDNSLDYTSTWSFLSRQLSFFKQAGEYSKQCRLLSETAGSVLWGAVNIGRNMVSMNVRQR